MDLADLPVADHTRWTGPLGLAAPLVGALALWAYAVARTDTSRLGDFGLVGALPAAFWIALALLTAGFWICVRDPLRAGRWSLAYTVGLIVLERATQALVYPTPLYSWAWKHDAVIEHLLTAGGMQRGDQLGDMAVYDQWPGFFAAQAALVRLTGVENAAMYMAWWPLLSSLLLLAPLLLIYRTFTQDRRLIWTAVWLFYVANWVGQDYFSPQSLALALYLGVIAIVLRRGERPTRGRRSRQALWTALLIPLITAIVISHQLTPVMLVASLAVLCVTRRYRDWTLLVTLLLVFLAWNLTASLPFLREAVPEMVSSFGDVSHNLETGYGSTPTGTGPVIVSWVSRLLSASVLLLALIGVLRRRVLRHRARPLLLLGAVPLLMLVANDYGSEMIFRVLLFMLPGACFFAASALLPDVRPLAAEPGGHGAPQPVTGLRAVLPGVALLALTAAFVPSYSGKDRLSYFPPQEVALVRQVIGQAPKGSLVVAAHRNYPLAYASYWNVQHYWFLDDAKSHVEEILRDPAATLARDMASVEPPGRAYFLLTQGQIANSEMNGMLTGDQLRSIRQSVAASPLFEQVGRNSAGVVYELKRTEAAKDTEGTEGTGQLGGEDPMRPQTLAIRLLPPFVGWCAIGATALPAGSPLRAVPVAVFLLAGPGAAVLRVCGPALTRHRAIGPVESFDHGFERDSDRLEQLVLAVLLSVSAAVVSATALMAAHAFSGQRVLVLLTLLTMLAACCPQLRGSRTRTARASSPPEKGAPL